MNAKESLKQAWDKEPVAVLAVVASVFAAAGKFIDAMTAAQSRRAYAKQVKLRSMNK